MLENVVSCRPGWGCGGAETLETALAWVAWCTSKEANALKVAEQATQRYTLEDEVFPWNPSIMAATCTQQSGFL